MLAGEIRSAFGMTEPDVASSDATNVATRITRDGDSYVVDGRKWWSSGAMNPRCAVFVVMGKTDPAAPRHRQQSMILVPRDAPGVTVHRALTVYGYDDRAHGGHAEVSFDHVRVPMRFSNHTDARPPYAIERHFMKRVDWVVDQALSNDLGVIIDVHHFQGMMQAPAGGK